MKSINFTVIDCQDQKAGKKAKKGKEKKKEEKGTT